MAFILMEVYGGLFFRLFYIPTKSIEIIPFTHLLFSFLLIASIFNVSAKNSKTKIEKVWETDTLLRTPESALYDAKKDIIYVSNIGKFDGDKKDGDGFISLWKPNEKISQLNWVKGLNDTKGLGLSGNKLFVADINEVVEIDIQTGKILKRYLVKEAIFLNDITTDKKGNVYISDMKANKIYLINKGKLSLWLDDAKLENPKGLFATNDGMLVGGNTPGILKKLSKDKTIIDWVSGIEKTDGIAEDEKGNYVVSNWKGQVFYIIKSSGEKIVLMDSRAENIYIADIDYSIKHKLLLIPTFYHNRVLAYKIVQ